MALLYQRRPPLAVGSALVHSNHKSIRYSRSIVDSPTIKHHTHNKLRIKTSDKKEKNRKQTNKN